MILTGEIKIIYDEQQVTDTFKKREFVIQTDETYPQQIKIETTKEKTELLNGLKIGDSVAVSINIRGREWNDKYFVNIQAWRIEKTGSAKQETKPEPVQTNDSDDIPF
jgi:hypothetical protein